MTKGTMQAPRLSQVVVMLAILGIAADLCASDWSKVPARTFVSQAVAAIDAIPSGEAGALATELAGVLAVGVGLDGLTSKELSRIVETAYGRPDVDPVALVRGVYTLVASEVRKPVVGVLVATAPASRKRDVAETIRRLALPAPPSLDRIVTRIAPIPWGKE